MLSWNYLFRFQFQPFTFLKPLQASRALHCTMSNSEQQENIIVSSIVHSQARNLFEMARKNKTNQEKKPPYKKEHGRKKFRKGAAAAKAQHTTKNKKAPQHNSHSQQQQKDPVVLGLRRVRTIQNQSQNLLLEFNYQGECTRNSMGIENWKSLVQAVLVKENYLLLPSTHHSDQHRFELRGDTMCVLLEILQAFLVTTFQHALAKMKTATENNITDENGAPSPNQQHWYPYLQLEHLDLLEIFPDHSNETLADYMLFTNTALIGKGVIAKSDIASIIRCTAHRAGVVVIKEEQSVCDHVWVATLRLIEMIFRPVCTELVLRSNSIQNDCGFSTNAVPKKKKKPLLTRRRQIHDVPPLPKRMRGTQQQYTIVHTPVPAQLEWSVSSNDALASYPFFRVYSTDEWLAKDERTADEERRVAMQDYDFDVFVDDDDDDSEDEENFSESDVDTDVDSCEVSDLKSDS